VLRHVTNLPGGEVRDRTRKASFRFFPGEMETGEPCLSDHRVVELPSECFDCFHAAPEDDPFTRSQICGVGAEGRMSLLTLNLSVLHVRPC